MSSTFRFDVFTGEHVLLAPGRATKPAGLRAALPTPEGPCPFCPGNEVEQDEIAVYPSEGPWELRVLSNRYPAVVRDAPDTGEGKGARGSHEVIVEGREHDHDLPDFDVSLRRLVMRAYRARVAELESHAGYVHLFRNRGVRAGSSQPHPHAQILATEHVPEAVARRWQRALAFHSDQGTTLLEHVLAEELAAGTRIVGATSELVVLCPIAPRFNGETWIVPRAPGGFSTADEVRVDALADVLGAVLPPVLALGRPAYNLVWRQPPVAQREHSAAFWTLEILPRGGAGAGYELSGQTMLVTVPPEETAARLRESVDIS